MTIDAVGLDLLFREARTHNKWHDQPSPTRPCTSCMKF